MAEQYAETYLKPRELDLELFGDESFLSTESENDVTSSPTSSDTAATSPGGDSESASSKKHDGTQLTEAADQESSSLAAPEAVMVAQTPATAAGSAGAGKAKSMGLKCGMMKMKAEERKKAEPNAAPAPLNAHAQQMVDDMEKARARDGAEKQTAAAADGESDLSEASKPNSARRSSAEEKQLKLERRMKATEERGLMMNDLKTRGLEIGGGAAQKRKREDGDDGAEKGAKREVMEADAVKMKETAPVASKPKGKRDDQDDDDTGRAAKRELTDDAAAEIAQQRKHAFVTGVEKSDERRDGVAGVAGSSIAATHAAETTHKVSKPAEQHLAPPALTTPTTTNTIPPPTGLEPRLDDDAFTLMLKAELRKPYIPEIHDKLAAAHYDKSSTVNTTTNTSSAKSKDDEQWEDPRIEAILQPLTETEKLSIALTCQARERAGHELPSLRQVQGAVDVALATRERKRKQAAEKTVAEGSAGGKGNGKVGSLKHAPKVASPLANDGVVAAAAGGGGKERKKLTPKPRLPSSAAPTAQKAKPKQTNPLRPFPTAATGARAPPPTNRAPSPPLPTTASQGAAAPPPPPPVDYSAFKVPELKDMCRARNLGVGGKKADLVVRLMEFQGVNPTWGMVYR